MAKYMLAHPEFLTKNNEDGVRRVYEGVHNYGKFDINLIFIFYILQ